MSEERIIAFIERLFLVGLCGMVCAALGGALLSAATGTDPVTTMLPGGAAGALVGAVIGHAIWRRIHPKEPPTTPS